MDFVLKRAGDSCVPFVTTLEITQSCNYRCGHCYNFNRTATEDFPKSEGLSREKMLSVIDEISESGALYLNLTGGEALLHPHLEDFIRRGRSNKMEVRLKTNGSLLSADRCERLNQAGLAGMDISLYGFSEESYSRLTGKTGMFVKTTEGILVARSAGFDLNISIILHRYNIHEMDQMVEFCHKHDLPFQFSTEITERYDGTDGARDFEITDVQFQEQLGGKYSDVFMVMNKEKSLQCSCAKSVCGISYSGEVFPCIGAPVPSGNLNHKAFSDIWKNSPVLNQIRNLKSEDFKECQTCEHIEFCGRSSGSIYVNTKKYTGCDPVTFRQAKLRHEFFLKNLN